MKRGLRSEAKLHFGALYLVSGYEFWIEQMLLVILEEAFKISVKTNLETAVAHPEIQY